MSEKTGPTFVIPCDKAQDLAKQIGALQTDDQELISLAKYLRGFHKGFALICVAEEDFILWPGGPDIRAFQLGGIEAKTTIIREDGVFSNDPLELPSREKA